GGGWLASASRSQAVALAECSRRQVAPSQGPNKSRQCAAAAAKGAPLAALRAGPAVLEILTKGSLYPAFPPCSTAGRPLRRAVPTSAKRSANSMAATERGSRSRWPQRRQQARAKRRSLRSEGRSGSASSIARGACPLRQIACAFPKGHLVFR